LRPLAACRRHRSGRGAAALAVRQAEAEARIASATNLDAIWSFVYEKLAFRRPPHV